MTDESPIIVDSKDLNKTFGVPNVLWQALIAAAVTVAVAWVTRNIKAEVTEVKQTVDYVKGVNDKNHQLLNSGKLEMQRQAVLLTAFKASITKDPVDVAAAEEAEDQYQAHKKEAELMAAQDTEANKK